MRSHRHWLSVALLLASLSLPAHAQMYIEGCNLGCSGGAGGAQVSCGITTLSPDADLRVRFSRPIDPASIDFTTFRLTNVNDGTLPIGTRFVDPNDPQVLVFRPSISWDVLGDPVFGFRPNTPYRIEIPGAAQGDAAPFITSTDVPALDNQSRMQCDVFVLPAPTTTGVVYCDGAQSCPCSNPGLPGRGCANSQDNRGVGLDSGGTASVSSDTLRMWLRGNGASVVIYFQGTLRENGGAGVPFGDGLRCVGGDIVRLRSQSAAGSARLIPVGPRTLSVQGLIPPAGATRMYQAFYRDDPSFCDPLPFNWTNAVEVTWAP